MKDPFAGPGSTHPTRREFLALTLPVAAALLLPAYRCAGVISPEDFGAVGDGIADDTIAVQKAVEAGRLVRGRAGSRYRINCTRLAWDTGLQDPHRAGKQAGKQGVAKAGGYRYGVAVPNGTVIEAAHFVLTGGSRAMVSSAFGCGDARSRTRHVATGFRNCTFTNSATGAERRIGQTCALVQSVDDFEFVSNRLEAEGARSLVGPRLFDCRNITIADNTHVRVQLVYAFEFCRGIAISGEQMTECVDGMDFDKRNSDITISNCRYDRARPLEGGDAVFEFNGARNVTLRNNYVRHAARYIICNGKPDVYADWQSTLRQSGASSYTAWRAFRSEGNEIIGTTRHAVQVGDDWGKRGHDGVHAGAGLVLADTYTDCGTALGDADGHAVVRIAEGTGVDLNCIVSGSPTRGFDLSSGAGSAAATQYSNLEITRFAGVIENTAGEAFVIRRPSGVAFAGLTVRNCGARAAAAARIEFPETRGARIDGTLEIAAGSAAARAGLDIVSKNFESTSWSADLAGAKISGFAEAVRLNATAGRPSMSRIRR